MALPIDLCFKTIRAATCCSDCCHSRDSGNELTLCGMVSRVLPERVSATFHKTIIQYLCIRLRSLLTGGDVGRYETTLPQNGCRHSQHHRVHAEPWLVREGTAEFTMNGATHRLGLVSLRFARSNEEHLIKNVGTRPATYFAVAIGLGAEA